MLRVVQPGLSSTIQDHGRAGYRAFGVPVSGAFDHFSAAIANALVGNSSGEAVVEMTLIGGVFQAECRLAIALAGAPMAAAIEASGGRRRFLNIPQSATLGAGDRLVLGGCASGARTYLAVRGGWQTRPILGSRSVETHLLAGDLLPANPGSTPVRRPSGLPRQLGTLGTPIRFLDGPDSEEVARQWLEATDFKLGSKSDRMGLRLEGPPLDFSADAGRLSSPVAPGSIQVAGGLPLVLGPACGTMGGYPHVAQVITADLDRLAQARPGGVIRFHRVELAEARYLGREARKLEAGWVLRLASFGP